MSRQPSDTPDLGLTMWRQISGVEDSRISEDVLGRLSELRDAFNRLQMYYEFGIDAVSTKVDILRREFEEMHEYSPIEHVRSRLKSPTSLVGKAVRLGVPLDVPSIRAEILDIAGIRITCSFVSDAYWIARMLSQQPDLTVLNTKDYIANPKPNGYRSLHLIVQVPVFLSNHTEQVPVELQIRTIAMDFWASVEHKLAYKYRIDMPEHLAREIEDAARAAAELDERMGRLRDEVRPVETLHPLLQAVEPEGQPTADPSQDGRGSLSTCGG